MQNGIDYFNQIDFEQWIPSELCMLMADGLVLEHKGISTHNADRA